MLEAVRRQLLLVTELLERQISSSEQSSASEPLRGILDTQKRHLLALVDCIETQQTQEQDKFERLVNQSQHNHRNNQIQIDKLRTAIDRVREVSPPRAESARLSPRSVSPATRFVQRAAPAASRPATASVSPVRTVRQFRAAQSGRTGPPARPRERSSGQAFGDLLRASDTSAAQSFDPQLSALEGLQKKLARQVTELQGLASFASDDPVARAISQSLAGAPDLGASTVAGNPVPPVRFF